MSKEIDRKLKQLCNISQHFETACQEKKKKRGITQPNNEGTYSLPVATPISPTIAEKRVK
jgi:hypothetical protein